MYCYCIEKSENQNKKRKKGPLIKMATTLKIFGVVSRFLYSGGWQVCICRLIKNKVYRLPYPDDFALQILLFRAHNFFFRPRREPFRRLGGQCFRDTLGCTCQMRLTDELMRLQISVHHLVFFSIIMAAKITKSSFKEIPYVKFGRPALKYLESESVLNGYLRYEN